jgi:hypothetical protein
MLDSGDRLLDVRVHRRDDPSDAKLWQSSQSTIPSTPKFHEVALGRRLGRADRGSHGAELGGLAACVLERRSGVGVDQFALRDVGVGPLNQQARVLTVEQRAGDSARPQIDALAGVL